MRYIRLWYLIAFPLLTTVAYLFAVMDVLPDVIGPRYAVSLLICATLYSVLLYTSKDTRWNRILIGFGAVALLLMAIMPIAAWM